MNVVWDIYDTYINKKTPIDTLNEVMPDGEDNPEQILNIKKKIFTKNSFLFTLLDLSCFIWIIFGISVAPESPFFILNLAISCAVYVVAIIYAISYVFKNKDAIIGGIMSNMKETFKNIAQQIPDIKNIHIINYSLKFIIISYVLYSHFIH